MYVHHILYMDIIYVYILCDRYPHFMYIYIYMYVFPMYEQICPYVTICYIWIWCFPPELVGTASHGVAKAGRGGGDAAEMAMQRLGPTRTWHLSVGSVLRC